MRVLIPLPFGEIEIRARKLRRARPFFWCVLLSVALHIVTLTLLGFFVFRTLVPLKQPQQEPVMVSISSATRIEHRARPVPARRPLEQPRAVMPAPKPIVRQRPIIAPRRVAERPVMHQRRTAPATLTQAQIAAQTVAYERTIAQAKAADDPVAGAAVSRVKPSTAKRSALNLEGTFGKPQPEGVLYPEKRWIDGPYVYYYVRYTAEYADGSSESGEVPWPIRFPANDDPFARDLHRMALPGPLPDYVLPANVAMQPLIKNCWDHHYRYCPIEHE